MSDPRVEAILDAAYICFTRHGVGRTTMQDIAREVGTSRTAVYQYVRSTDDAFRLLADRLLADALANAQTAVQSGGTLTARLIGALEAKLELTMRLWRDSPAHAPELLGAHARLSAESSGRFDAAMRDLLTEAIGSVLTPATSAPSATPATSVELADILLAFTRGVESDLSDPDAAVRQLRRGVALLVAGASPETTILETT